ncbi:unnamed protein product [Aphanomyces euteiches]|nr:hypothetical protein AeRB84_003388 [Aphanomyces euteiches]
MTKFVASEASAPGKVILFGEHAVVYGIPAVAASVSSLRVSTRVTFGGEPVVGVALENLKSEKDGEPLRRSWPSNKVKEIVPNDAVFLPRPSPSLTAALTNFLKDEHPKDANALRPPLFLLLAIVPQVLDESTGVELTVQSGDFPVGAGLGSSAAFSVSVAAALLRCREESVSLDTINSYAFAGEVLLHDDPSGVDNSVATYGGALVYRKNPKSLETFSMPKLRILLTNTHVPRETKVLVNHVRSLHTADPVTVEGHFSTIEELAKTFQQQVQSNSLSESDLANMMATNQACLDALEVGHQSITTICEMSAKYTMVTKLTGAGGGGCTITLVPADATDDDIALLKYELTQEGFTCIETALGGPGVEFHQVEE